MDIIKDQVYDQYIALRGLWKNKRTLAYQVGPHRRCPWINWNCELSPLPDTQLGHDCLFCTDDLEDCYGADKL